MRCAELGNRPAQLPGFSSFGRSGQYRGAIEEIAPVAGVLPLKLVGRGLVRYKGSPPHQVAGTVVGNSAMFSWRLGTLAFQLQDSPAFGVTFTNVPVTITMNGSYVSTTRSLSESQRFFRLEKP